MDYSQTRGLNRDVIKYIAMFTMFLNHFAIALLEPETILYEVFVNIGYFTAITMCYFLVEGYSYTRSKKTYGIRLLIFALISQIPYTFALNIMSLNMMFTLIICLFIIMIMENIKNPILRDILIVILVLFSICSDWALFAPIFTIMFVKFKKSKQKTTFAYMAAFLLFFLFEVTTYLGTYNMGKAVIYGLISGIGIIISGVVIVSFYNGKRAEKGKSFSKWFFYIFYPGHLLVLWLIKIVIANYK